VGCESTVRLNLIKAQPERVAAAVLAQSIGYPLVAGRTARVRRKGQNR